ncbi:MAG: TonB-dependent receptor [Bacteroidota bacterium]|jgi:TonB-linked SusC/RagA family outer membrane protein|nr:TonB-dependent receptor [Bacteroidota bacterium]
MSALALVGAFICSTSMFAGTKPAAGSAIAESTSQQGKITVKGKVIDQNGAPVIQASVLQKGTTSGTVTDFDGNFVLAVDGDATLEVSCIGYLTQAVVVNNRDNIIITLAEDAMSLEETVVVGYATQKKANLTGAVSTINVEKDINRRSTNTISNLLAGAAPGLVATANNSSGSRPGANSASLRIRGTGTTNDASPLVVVDGNVSSMDDVNPTDVENISILKDAASSAIYGSRAANGVILITTKKGKSGAPTVTYNGKYSLERANTDADYFNIESNYATYMEYMNDARANRGLSPYFSQGKIDEWRSHEKDTDPKSKLRWPNTDWTKVYFRTARVQDHTISLQGGTDNVRYYVSGNFYDNPGVIKWTDYRKISFRSNIEVDVTKFLTIGLNISAFRSEMDPNSSTASTGGDAISWGAAAGSPGIVLVSPDGRYGEYNNPEDNTGQRNANAFRRMNFYKHDIPDVTMSAIPRFSVKVTPFKGFEIEGTYTYNYKDNEIEQVLQDMDLWNFYPEEPVRTLKTVAVYNRKWWYKYTYQTADLVARYNKEIGNLKLNAIAGTSGEFWQYRFNAARKYNDESLAPGEHNDYRLIEWDVMNTSRNFNANIRGNRQEWAMRSYFARLNLNWADKYLFEANFRADGSSKFSPEHRWGYFPSFSAGWLISEEPFFNKGGLFNFLKLRASWGSLGNNVLGGYDGRWNWSGLYEWQTVFGAANYVLNNGTTIGGMSQNNIANNKITWERTTVTNVGVDFGAFDGRLTGNAEVYDKLTDGILLSLPASLTIGTVGVPKQNAAVVDNRGFEVQMRWNDMIGEDVTYWISANAAYNKNKVIDFATPSVGTYSIKEGEPINYLYIYEADRILKTPDDIAYRDRIIAANPNMFSSLQKPELGDILYKDMNGDGVLNADDRVKKSNGNQPSWSYGLSLGAEWKGFDLSMIINGVANWKDVLCDVVWRSTPAWGYTLNRTIAQGAWTAENAETATFPRLLMGDGRNEQLSTFWMYNRSYLRLRNVQLGYTLPETLTRKFFVSRLRFYLSLDNALTITKWPGMDPELAQGRAVQNHPINKVTTFGVTITL